MDLEILSQKQSYLERETQMQHSKNFFENINSVEDTLEKQIYNNLKKTQQNMLEEYEYDDSKNLYYGEVQSTQPISSIDKSYFRRLYSINIPEEVKRKVEEKIITCNRRIHVISDETLCTYVILAHQELNIPYNIENIIRLFNLDPTKTNVFNFLSKATTKSNITLDNPTSINIIVIKPSNLIPEVFKDYITKYNIKFLNGELLEPKLVAFAEMIEKHCPMATQYSPRETASAIIFSYFYFYFADNAIQVKKSNFSKKIFSTLAGVTEKRFSTSYNVLSLFLNNLRLHNPTAITQYY